MGPILLILDGMGDRDGFPAGCRVLSQIGKNGASGFFETTPDGFAPESVACILTLLGVPAAEIPRHARGYFEAAAHGIETRADDLILRCNLAATGADGRLLSSCGEGFGRETLDRAGEVLAKAWSGTRHIRFFPLGGYKNLMVLEGGAKELGELRTFPPHQNGGRPLAELLPRGGEAAALLRKLIEESGVLLAPFAKAGRVLTAFFWSPSVRCMLRPFAGRFGLSGRPAAVCATEVVRGMALALGFDAPVIEGATAETDTDLSAKALAALEAAKRAPFVLVHVNGADEAAHRRNPTEKAAFLMRCGRELVRPLTEQTGAPLLICPDHATFSDTGEHGAGPQPFYLRKDRTKGVLGTLPGTRAAGLLLDRAGV